MSKFKHVFKHLSPLLLSLMVYTCMQHLELLGLLLNHKLTNTTQMELWYMFKTAQDTALVYIRICEAITLNVVYTSSKYIGGITSLVL